MTDKDNISWLNPRRETIELRGERRNLGSRPRQSTDYRRVLRRTVDVAVAAAGLALAALVVVELGGGATPAEQQVPSAQSAALEKAILQPKIQQAASPVPAAFSQHEAAPSAAADAAPLPKPQFVAPAPPPQPVAASPAPPSEPAAQPRTVTINGSTYVAGREPHTLGTIAVEDLPPDAR
jgi:hypothetical protein